MMIIASRLSYDVLASRSASISNTSRMNTEGSLVVWKWLAVRRLLSDPLHVSSVRGCITDFRQSVSYRILSKTGLGVGICKPCIHFDSYGKLGWFVPTKDCILHLACPQETTITKPPLVTAHTLVARSPEEGDPDLAQCGISACGRFLVAVGGGLWIWQMHQIHR